MMKDLVGATILAGMVALVWQLQTRATFLKK